MGCLSDVGSRKAWEATNLFNLALRTDNIQDHLSIELGDQFLLDPASDPEHSINSSRLKERVMS